MELAKLKGAIYHDKANDCAHDHDHQLNCVDQDNSPNSTLV